MITEHEKKRAWWLGGRGRESTVEVGTLGSILLTVRSRCRITAAWSAHDLRRRFSPQLSEKEPGADMLQQGYLYRNAYINVKNRK
jgi:hypothetical protein